jgi:dATP pyrophosphohydrolase
MARAPYEVFAACYKNTMDGIFVYAIFKTSDTGYWSLIAGGGEDGEEPLEAVGRESFEEAGIPKNARYYKLDTIASLPANAFPEGKNHWPANLFIIPGYYYAVNIGSINIRLSQEHTEYKLVTYQEAEKILKWQSDITALWELEQRLQTNDLKDVKDS